MANGDVPYVVKFDVIHDGKMSISAYYIEGFPYAISGYYGTRHSATMMMMVVLYLLHFANVISCKKSIAIGDILKSNWLC